MPESLRPKRQAKRSWPYQKQPSAPGEAHVELLPANSNTFAEAADIVAADDIAEVDGQWDQSDVREGPGHDNVILMPLAPSGGRGDGYEGDLPWHGPVGQTGANRPVARPAGPREGGPGDALAQAIEMPPEDTEESATELPDIKSADEDGFDGGAKPAPKMTPPPLPVMAAPDRSAAEPVVERIEAELIAQDDVASGPVEARMNVRITQRTADFEIPFSMMSQGQPIAFVKHGAKVTFSDPMAELVSEEQAVADGQLRLDFVADREALRVPDLPRDATGGEAVEPGVDDEVSPGFEVIRLDDLGAVEEDYSVSLPTFETRDDLPSEDDLVEISKRFAPLRRAE